MASRLPYDTSADALLLPAKNAVYFQGWTPGVDHQNHDLLCAEMSRLAYAEPEEIVAALDSVGFDAADKSIEAGGTQGFVAHHRELQISVLAFRGTESKGFQDLISDLDTLQTDRPDGSRVHSGFLKAYGNEVKERVKELLEDRAGTLLVTGHSLGAALATLASLDTQPASLITFGSPRVGDARFARLFTGLNVRRYVNCCDVVTRIPPEKFDRDNLRRLLTELGNFKGFALFGLSLEKAAQAAANFAADVFAAAFDGVAAENTFLHVSPPRYVRADGTVMEEPNEEEITQDQQSARSDYRHLTKPGLQQLLELFQSLGSVPEGQISAHLGQLPRNLLQGLFALTRGDPVPLRDLADHAPINYLSSFTGRTPRAGQP